MACTADLPEHFPCWRTFLRLGLSTPSRHGRLLKGNGGRRQNENKGGDPPRVLGPLSHRLIDSDGFDLRVDPEQRLRLGEGFVTVVIARPDRRQPQSLMLLGDPFSDSGKCPVRQAESHATENAPPLIKAHAWPSI